MHPSESLAAAAFSASDQDTLRTNFNIGMRFHLDAHSDLWDGCWVSLCPLTVSSEFGMSTSRDRALSIVELLAQHVGGLPLFEIADRLDIPRSATHRLLTDLKETDYVRQDQDGSYSLTVKLVALGLNYLSCANFNNLVQPVLERVAVQTSDLVMLSVIEGERLMRVAKVQGAQRGLQYNPVEETELYLAGSANGQAWLSCLSDDAAIQLLAKQGIRAKGYGSTAPRTIKEAMTRVRAAREQGYAVAQDSHETGISAIAVAIRSPVGSPGANRPLATLSVAGPSIRLTTARIEDYAPLLVAAAKELGITAKSSALFRAPQYMPSPKDAAVEVVSL
jgi:IclR family transcriptional regulator, acetate operon repressor